MRRTSEKTPRSSESAVEQARSLLQELHLIGLQEYEFLPRYYAYLCDHLDRSAKAKNPRRHYQFLDSPLDDEQSEASEIFSGRTPRQILIKLESALFNNNFLDSRGKPPYTRYQIDGALKFAVAIEKARSSLTKELHPGGLLEADDNGVPLKVAFGDRGDELTIPLPVYSGYGEGYRKRATATRIRTREREMLDALIAMPTEEFNAANKAKREELLKVNILLDKIEDIMPQVLAEMIQDYKHDQEIPEQTLEGIRYYSPSAAAQYQADSPRVVHIDLRKGKKLSNWRVLWESAFLNFKDDLVAPYKELMVQAIISNRPYMSDIENLIQAECEWFRGAFLQRATGSHDVIVYEDDHGSPISLSARMQEAQEEWLKLRSKLGIDPGPHSQKAALGVLNTRAEAFIRGVADSELPTMLAQNYGLDMTGLDGRRR